MGQCATGQVPSCKTDRKHVWITSHTVDVHCYCPRSHRGPECAYLADGDGRDSCAVTAGRAVLQNRLKYSSKKDASKCDRVTNTAQLAANSVLEAGLQDADPLAKVI